MIFIAVCPMMAFLYLYIFKLNMILVFSLRNVGGCERVLVGECRVSVGALLGGKQQNLGNRSQTYEASAQKGITHYPQTPSSFTKHLLGIFGVLPCFAAILTREQITKEKSPGTNVGD